MNSAFRKALEINEVGSIDTILKRFRPTVETNEGNHETLTKTLKSTSQMPVTGETMKLLLIYQMEGIFMSQNLINYILNYISILILMFSKEDFLYF
jgi:nucleoside-triphosphatase THEP1